MGARYKRFCMCRKYTGEEAYDSKRKKIACPSFVYYFRYPPPLHFFFTQSSVLNLSVIRCLRFLIPSAETIFSCRIYLLLSSPFVIWPSSARTTLRELYCISSVWKFTITILHLVFLLFDNFEVVWGWVLFLNLFEYLLSGPIFSSIIILSVGK